MANIALITGATGNVGSAVVSNWPQDSEIKMRVGLFNLERERERFEPEHDVVQFDFKRPETFPAAFDGVDRLFLVRPPQLANVSEDIAPAVWAARGAGVRHIVFLSLMGVENNRVVPHHKIEQLILETGMDYTFLRASFFMQNLDTTHRAEIRDRSELIIPVGKSKTSFVDARDLGAVGAKALTEPGHENKKYTLTGPEALDYYQVAQILSHTLGRTIRYEAPSILRFIRYQREQKTKWNYLLVMTALYTITRFGNAKDVTHEVQNLLGREPILFQQYAEDYQDVWKR